MDNTDLHELKPKQTLLGQDMTSRVKMDCDLEYTYPYRHDDLFILFFMPFRANDIFGIFLVFVFTPAIRTLSMYVKPFLVIKPFSVRSVK